MDQTDIVHVVEVEIVSDVVCPWCIVGFLQLRKGLEMTGLGARIRWHPFELNPGMAPEGQNLTEHIVEKYGATPEQSQASRAQLVAIGQELGFAFNFTDETRMVNTFRAHQLLDWAAERGLQHPLKLALFKAHFTDARDVSDINVLVDVAEEVGLDAGPAREALETNERADVVRQKENYWMQNGIQGVPTICIGGKIVLTGAQEASVYADAIRASAQIPAV
ncbi:DsbA family oxidoreductase [Marinibacterium profundimaris]|uniref:DSBA oxidoreductase n=1 Tax=Marinibacterium profundimaris TaxID=1679460 RepID=A0A225NGP0_9RHOB|nr:DsbA family oxidoreductase [Marinibacterium profundimaris]OWU72636.1 DSBA oxidoreductase [Marinibacterium profundimaris]